MIKHQQQISRCMTILTTHGGVLGHYHLLDLKYVAVAAVDDNAVFVIEGCTKEGSKAELNISHLL